MGKLSDTAPAVGSAPNTVSKAPTSEQLRIAQLLVDPKTDDHSIKDKVSKVMELTRCNESTALVALHDYDNDVEQAVDKLLEGGHQGEWIVQEGKKSKKIQHQQPYNHQSYHQHRQKEDHYGAEDGASGKHYDNFEDENSTSLSAPYQSRGPSRGVGHNGDFPPRFRGRGGSGIRPGRRFDKENEPFEYSGVDRGRGRGRGGHGDVGGERGRGRGFASRGGRRGGGFGQRDGGFDQKMGSWDSSEVESNTWDNSMANSSNTRGDGPRRIDEWKGADDNNTWDNSMAQTAAPVNAKKPQQKRSNEWNATNTTDDWGGEEDWTKGLVIESSGVHKQQANSAPAPVSSAPHASVASSYASAANAGNVRGESINVNMLFSNQLPETQSSNSSQGLWTSKQATADLKNELGIGKVAAPSIGEPTGLSRQREALPLAKPNAAKVELPSIGSRNAIGPIDVQFGDMTLLSDSQPLFAFDAQSVFKTQPTAAISQPQDPLSLRHGQIDSSTGVYQRTQKSEHANGPDLLLGSGEGGAKDVSYSLGGGYGSTTQAVKEQQFGSAGSAIRQIATGPTGKNGNSGLSSLTGSHQKALLSGNTGGANVPGQVPVNDAAVQQLSKDVNFNQGGIALNVGSAAHGSTSTNFGMSSAPSVSRSPASIVTTKPQVTSSLNVNAAIPQYQQAMAAAGLSPYLYDQMSLNSIGFLPAQNLFLNAAGGIDMRTLTQLPPMAGNTIATGRDVSGDLKAPFMRQDTGSNLAAAGLANLSVPPPGLPAPTVSNAEQAAQILSMAGMSGLYPTYPLLNPAAPQFLAPQFLVPNVSATSTVTTGSQYQRTTGYPQAPMYNTGYEDIQLPQDYGKNNYAILSNSNQTKTVSSGTSGMTIGVNDGNKGYAGGLKGYDSKSFVPATATPPSLGNMSFPAPFQTTATTGAAYGYPGYMPPVNMNMMASPMAALASNVQLSNDMLGAAPMNQRGGGQNSKGTTSGMGKPTGQYPFPSWGN